ncbi:type I pullulanase [Anaerobacillus alkalilacustris]|nr:type I pullulanase [Anaerobacillus alkalilacustris]
MVAKNAYIDELMLITIPFSEVDEELSHFTIINTQTNEPLTIKTWRKSNERWRYELYLEKAVNLGTEYRVFTNKQISFDVKTGQVVRTETFDDLYFYDLDDLGITYTKDETTFKLWAPTATEVQLILFNGNQQQRYPLTKADKGVWHYTVFGDLEGTAYKYRLLIDRMWREAVDPYTKAVTVNGERGVVVDLSHTNPSQWNEVKKPSYKSRNDAIIYEVHVRDFSIDENSGMKHKGKYKALTETGTRGPSGTLTGLDYLVDLGVTHVQLLPVQDFGSVDETKSLDKYNWGYDTIHYSAIEGSYSLKPEDPKQRILELKEVVKSFHKQGIRVILDVVYNHVYIHHRSNFERIVPGYYFRYKLDGSLANGTGVGNDIASERKMVRKFIVDSVKFLAEEYQVDGFRFDLMGILDLETMNKVRDELNEIDPSIIVIGEGWDLATPIQREKKAIIANSDLLPSISHFNDQFRDKLKGSIFDHTKKGFCNGNGELKETFKMLVSGSIKGFYHIEGIFREPYQSVNYVECHDNHTLWDKLELSNGDQKEEVRASMHRLATAMTLLSQGIPFLHAGQEFYRTKKGVENSYCSSDEINKLDWKRKAFHMDYVDYVKGLVALRKTHNVFRFSTADQVKKNMHILDTPSCCLAYMLKDNSGMFVIAHNSFEGEKELILPSSGYWDVLVEGSKSAVSPLRTFEGAKIIVQGISTTVLFHPKSY